MKKTQQGMTFIGLVLTVAAIVFVAVIGMKMVPSYIEYFAVKKAIKKVANEAEFKTMSPKAIKESFEKSTIVDNVKSISKNDLIIRESDNGRVVEIEYQVVVPLVANVSALIDFKASSENPKLVK